MHNAGRMRERVTIRALSLASDGYGGSETTQRDVATVSAEVQPVRGSEGPYQGQVTARQTYLITIRYRSDVTPENFIFWRGKELQVISVSNRDMRRRYLSIEAVEGEAI